MTTTRPRLQLTRWLALLRHHLPHLSRPQRRTLALWSYAATLTEHIGQTTCAAFLAEAIGTRESAFRQRLREFYRPAEGKRGPLRRELDVQLVFGPLLAWVLHLLRPPEVVLALDPTLCRDRLAVLTVAVVAHGSAIPVAWRAVRANRKEAWMPHWRPLLARLRAAIPEQTRVIVTADRGLQSRNLFDEIVDFGWHPMMRLTRCGTWRERGQGPWTRLSELPLGPGEYYVARGQLFRTRPHRCTLVAVWREDFDEPWLLMTDLPPGHCERAFYGLRCWIEQGFRSLKSGGLRCERLRVTEPARAERIWLVLAVSLLWTHAAGAAPAAAERVVEGVRRRLSAHRRGWIRLLARLVRGEKLMLPKRVIVATAPIPTFAELARPPS